jgi:predicted nucleic acid-binding Zn ribbon protein
MTNIIHLSLFENTNCVVCGEDVEDNALHCLGCCEEYLESKNKEDERE